MFRGIGVLFVATVVLSGCGKRETDVERRQREALDLCYKGADCLRAKDNVGAESLFKQALDVDPFCDKARNALASMEKERRTAVSAARTQIASFKAALDMFWSDLGTLPTTRQGLVALRLPPSDLRNQARWGGPYLENDVPPDPWGNPYQYACPGAHNPASYDVWSLGPDGVSGTEDDIGNW
jgi:general secretion pathway protein G